MSDETLLTDDSILEPLNAYRSKYENSFRSNCEEYFDDLLRQSGVSEEQNKRTVSQYNAQRALVEETKGKLSRDKAFKGLLIFLIVLGAIFLFVSIGQFVGESVVAGVIFLLLGILFIVGSAVLIAKVIQPRLKQNEEKRAEQQKKADELLRKAWEEVAPLNALFEGNITKKLIEKTVPLLDLDDNFNVRRYDYLSGKYGYGKDDDPNVSTIGILTGQIVGNPFVVDRVLVHSMGVCTYSGSIVIHWETYETDSDGNLQTVHHSQTLTATVTKPKPEYSRQTRLIYGNEAAPDLHFSRRPSHSEDLSEKERERKVEKGTKQIRKKQEAALKSGSHFTEMGNAEFEVLFGATDRDNDVQFRLLFTPLAQKNMLALLTDEEGYGDDFYMRKSGCLNYISSEHSAMWDMEEKRSRYFSYSVELSRKTFLDFNEQYFRSLYFDLAPLLSIPLYQQHKPHEYIYQESYPRYFTRQETEYAVNQMPQDAFAPPYAGTESILKTTFLGKDGGSDRVRVTASAYKTVERVDYIPVYGGDGNYHDVPVPWIEYIPISMDTDVEMKELGLSDRDFMSEMENGIYKSAISRHGSKAYGYHHGILCCIVPEGESSFDADFIIKK